MSFKCSVKNCQGNFTTNGMMALFDLPKCPKLLKEWLRIIELKTPITKSTRICTNHFSKNDITVIDNHQSLKSNAIPIEYNPKNADEQNFISYSQLCTEVNEKYYDLKIFSNVDGICIYSLKSTEDFNNVIFDTKIIVKKNMEIRVICDEYEDDLGFLQTLSQLNEIVVNYFSSEKVNDEIFEEEILIDEEFNDQNEMSSSELTNNETDNQLENENIEELDDLIEFDHPYKCENCCIIFTNDLGLQHHKKTCKILKICVQTCKICNQQFSSTLKLKIHQRNHVNKTKCDLCDVILVSNASLKRHIKAVHLKERQHKCSICNKLYATASTRNSHEKTHENNAEMEQYLLKQNDGVVLYSCPKCNENFHKSTHLKNHIKKNCFQTRKKRTYKYPCKFCDKEFVSKIKAAEHYFEKHDMKIDKPQKFCFECHIEVDNYVNHIRTHTCLYTCSNCGLKFLTKETCKQHETLKHPNENPDSRPFKCSNCSTSFKSEHHLKSHVTSYHAQIEKEFLCEICKNRFSTRALLNAHMRTHDKNSSIFKCKLCICSYKKLLNLKIHSMAVHQSENIYVCGLETCEESFKLLRDLKLHRQIDHGMNLNVQKYFTEDIQ